MLKILINAYACSPNMGSEPGMAWNWCLHLAKQCELHIITEGEFRVNIEAVLPTLEQGENMHFYYNPVSEDIRKMCWNQGDWRFYKHYKKWQFKTYQLAEEIVKTNKIDVLHQLNMIGFREPGYLWKITNVPLIWGPVDAKQKFPVAYLDGASLKTKLFVNLKNSITYLQLRFSKRLRLAVKSASVVVSASTNSQTSFNRFFGINSPLLNETGCYIQDHKKVDKTNKKNLDLLWVGKLDFRKQLPIALQTLKEIDNKDILLHIVGGGDDLVYKSLAKSLGIEKQCKWYGLIKHSEVQQLMQKCDLFFFTSVAEGTPHVVLEAISNNLPVVCFNTCGQGDVINKNVGVKIALSNPKQSAVDFANKIEDLFVNREKLELLATNCKQRQIELSWGLKAKKLVEFYTEALKK
ncbi:glycosyltransferase [Polaribacter sp. Z014]|uniref:glycosyltransferase n=1 Tax=Polaribacter sp. Z014 TaxID=2927126 RepID=UPI0020227734|nr:glycosyltransferase [Polaribacter sp. Z014]MCL7764548.1 glycosyltransferase [Polaribacter sp. Z014]